MLECPVCQEELSKLKELSCNHAFCEKCLEGIREKLDLICPLCRTLTQLSPLGVAELKSRFAGKINCTDCTLVFEFNEMRWCTECESLFCCNCMEKHSGHVTEPANKLGPVQFCMSSFDRFCALHTILISIQKEVIHDYFDKLQRMICKQLDDDVASRIRNFKREKQRLCQAFDITGFGGPAPTVPLDNTPKKAPDGAKIVETTAQLTKVVPLKKMMPLPKEGPIFSPPKLEALAQVLMKTDKFATFKPNYDLRSGDKLQTVQKYIGTGIIVNPCDLSVVPEHEWLLVASTTHGIFKFTMSGTLVGRFVPENNKGQIAGVDYCNSNQTIIATVLESFCEWKLLVMDLEFKIKDTIVCPSEPKISISWNRYCTMMDPTHVLVTTGDNNLSAIWLCDLATHEWTSIFVAESCTFRRAAMKTGDEGCLLIYVPDMRNQEIRIFSMENWKLTGVSKLTNEAITRDLPICVDLEPDTLIIGFWRSGNLIMGSLSEGCHQTIACAGERNLIHAKRACGKIFALCKETELVCVYDAK